MHPPRSPPPVKAGRAKSIAQSTLTSSSAGAARKASSAADPVVVLDPKAHAARRRARRRGPLGLAVSVEALLAWSRGWPSRPGPQGVSPGPHTTHCSMLQQAVERVFDSEGQKDDAEGRMADSEARTGRRLGQSCGTDSDGQCPPQRRASRQTHPPRRRRRLHSCASIFAGTILLSTPTPISERDARHLRGDTSSGWPQTRTFGPASTRPGPV